jgi:hypothetical protein
MLSGLTQTGEMLAVSKCHVIVRVADSRNSPLDDLIVTQAPAHLLNRYRFAICELLDRNPLDFHLSRIATDAGQVNDGSVT